MYGMVLGGMTHSLFVLNVGATLWIAGGSQTVVLVQMVSAVAVQFVGVNWFSPHIVHVVHTALWVMLHALDLNVLAVHAVHGLHSVLESNVQSLVL